MRHWTQPYIDKVFRPFFEVYLKQIGQGKFSEQKVADAIGQVAKSTINRLLKDHTISPALENKIYSKFGLIPFKQWKDTSDFRGRIIDALTNNYWLSYRFNSKRQLYISSWIFTAEENDIQVWKTVPKGLDFKGKFDLNNNLCLSGTLSNNSILLTYQTYFSNVIEGERNNHDNNFKNPNALECFKCIILNLIVKHGDEIYSTIEILIKEQSGAPKSHNYNYVQEKTNCHIFFSPDKDFQPSNNEYVAYNFLTRYNTKSRVNIANRDKNLRDKLFYQHTIRVACPVRSISTKMEFEKLSICAKSLKEVLINVLHFKKENIYFELLQYDRMDQITEPDEYLFEKNKTINYTHFLGLVPKLEKRSMGVIAEIFYRIGKKFPITIFFEDESSLSETLLSLKNNHQIVNASFYKHTIESVPKIIEKNPEKLLGFRIP